MHLMGSRTRLLVVTAVATLFVSSLSALGPLQVSAQAAASDGIPMTDGSFFGVWSGGTWTTVGKLNYSYSAALAPVEAEVKAGDYPGARAALDAYFSNRSERSTPAITTADPLTAALALSDTFTGPQPDKLVGEIVVPTTAATVSLPVTATVALAASSIKQAVFMLLGETKSSSVASFNSREAAADPPQLVLTVDGSPQTLVAQKDTHIVGGSAVNFGSSTTLKVNAAGYPFDGGENRSYLSFDLGNVPSGAVISSAALRLKGFTAGSTAKSVLVFEAGNVGWSESTMSWTNTLGSVYSWQGAASSTDWNPPVNSDLEYVNVLTRHNFLAPLAKEFADGSGELYADKAVALMRDFLHDKPAGYPRSLEAGVRSVNWIKAYDTLRPSAAMSPDAGTEILKSLWQHADFLKTPANFNITNNWGVIQTNGLFHIAAYLPEFRDAPSWRTLADERIVLMAGRLIASDGSYSEPTSTYTAVTARLFLAIKEMAVKNGLTLPADLDTRLKGLVTYLMDSSDPSGNDVMYGDSDALDNRPLIATFGALFNDPALIHFGSGGAAGDGRDPPSAFYPTGKVASMRSSWEPTASYLHINNQNIGGSHSHPDLLHLDVSAFGQRLLVDPGRNSYNDEPISNWLRKTTRAHNTITIDGAPQVKTGAAFQPTWYSNDSFDLFEGTHKGYAEFTHKRGVLFVKPGYWVVSDQITAPTGTHTYEQNWHYLPTANPAVDAVSKAATTNFADGANVAVIPADPAGLSATAASGYYASGYGTAVPAGYTSYSKTGAGDVTFDTVIIPREEGESSIAKVSRVAISPAVPTSVATSLEVDLDGTSSAATSYYYASHESSNLYPSRTFGEFTFDGKVANVQTDDGGTVRSAQLASGTTLVRGGEMIVSAPDSVRDLGLSWQQQSLTINGSDLVSNSDSATAIRMYAPGVTSVSLNGDDVPFTASGDYVYAAAVSPLSRELIPAVGASASSQLSSTSWRALNVTDGNPATSWSSVVQAGATGQQWVSVDTGAINSFNEITVVPRRFGTNTLAFPADFSLQSSTDGQTWTTIPGQSFVNYPNPVSGAGEIFELAGPINARYVRVLATRFRDDGSSYYAQIADVRVSRVPDGRTPVRAVGATASSQLSSTSWRAANVIDDNATTNWSSVVLGAATGQQWVAVDAGVSTSFNEVTVVPRRYNGATLAFPENFSLQSSLDGVTWTTIPGQVFTAYPNPATGDGEVFELAQPVTTRYLRVLATKFRTDGFNYHVQISGIALARVADGAD